jgi:hypothetical protein
MKNFIYFTLCLLLLASCQWRAKKPNAAVCTAFISGNWVCIDVIDAIADAKSTKVLREFPPYTELSFVDDSAKLIAVNGQVEQISLTYTRSGSKVNIREFDGGEDVQLTLTSDSVMVFYDELNDKHWQYVKASPELISDTLGFKEAFVNTLNTRMLAGGYMVTDLESGKRYSEIFKPDGSIQGSPNFTRYMLCFSGDCMNLSDDVSLVKFFLKDDSEEFYGWTIENGVLSIYALLMVNQPDEMTEYVIDRKQYELRRK